MSENQLTPAAIRAEADRLATVADRDPGAVDPVAVGAVGYLLLDLLDDTHADFAVRLAQAVRLLRFGVEFAPDHRFACSWRMSLAMACAHQASLDGGTGWEEALGWAEAAVATAGAPDERADAVLELVDVHVMRLEGLWEERLQADERVAELDKVLEVFREFDGTLSDPADQAFLDFRSARLLSARFDVVGENEDLDRALTLLGGVIPLLSEDDPDLPGALSVQAELYHSRYLGSEEESQLAHAVRAAERAVATTEYADPARPDRYLLLARLLLARADLAESTDPDDRDRLIDCLLVAVTGDVGPYTWYVLGDELLKRGRDNEVPGDLHAATHWLRRYAEQEDPSEDDAWLAWSLLTEAYSELFRLTDEQDHADRTVEYATRALEFAMPRPELVEEMHWRRLVAAIQNGARPDLAGYVTRNPVVDWLREAQHLIDGARHCEPTTTRGLLAFNLGWAWFRVVAAAPNQVITHPSDLYGLLGEMQQLFELSGVLDDLTDELRLLLETIGELVTNMHRVLTRNEAADFAKLETVLADPQLAGEYGELAGLAAMLLFMAGCSSGSIRTLDAAIDLFGRRQETAPDAGDRREAQALLSVVRLVRAFHLRVSPPRMYVLGRRAWEQLTALPESVELMPILTLVDSLLRPVTLMVGAEPLPPLRRTGMGEGWLPSLMAPFTMVDELLSASQNRDVDAVRSISERLEVQASTSPDETVRSAAKGMLAMAFDRLSELDPFDHDVLDKAINASGDALEMLRIDRFAMVEDQITSLANLLRRRQGPGDLARSRQLGLEVVKNAGWRVLLQSGSTEAMEVARTAVPTVRQLIAWCLADGAITDLVRILDARRSLVLRAANTTRSVSVRLTAIGRSDLAAEWEAAGGVEQALLPEHGGPDTGWGALRHKVLMALDEDFDGMLTPPTVEELQSALRRQGSDVLVYLLPANDHHEAMAVLLPSTGEPEVLLLPTLGMAIPVERYQSAYDAWDTARTSNGPEYEKWRESLRETCSWAWQAAAKDLLEAGKRISGDRDPRLVLVPIGILGLVPWHAAYRMIAGCERYLLQDATVSYVPSGRLFCEAVERADGVQPEAAVLVGNPGRNLAEGAVEAMAIRDSCYERGVVLGGTGQAPRKWTPSPDGAGTPAEVCERLRSPLGLLHLACHAVADVREPLRSSIQLAGAPTSDLSASELLELSPTRPLDLGLVVLAGCTTHVSGVDYDEALSLSTTFLAIGAQTVVGSLWQVPAGWATAHLMFLFHHYRRHERFAPAEALRRAQIAMLLPEPPHSADMPEGLKKLRPAAAEKLKIEHWAGFAHQGF